MLPVEPAADEAYGVTISITITDVSYGVDTDRRDIYSLSCDGRVVYKSGKPYNSTPVTVEFGEYDRNRLTGEWPERAFAGGFGYWAKLPGDDSSLPHFAFYLRYVPEDARKVLLPLLAQEAGTEVVLVVQLVNKEEDLLSTTEQLHGDVRSYSFRVRKRLFNDGDPAAGPE